MRSGSTDHRHIHIHILYCNTPTRPPGVLGRGVLEFVVVNALSHQGVRPFGLRALRPAREPTSRRRVRARFQTGRSATRSLTTWRHRGEQFDQVWPHKSSFYATVIVEQFAAGASVCHTTRNRGA